MLGSAPEESRERCREVFDAVGSKTLWLGEAGAAPMKLVLNNWLLSLTESLAETIAPAESLAIDPELFLETIGGGSLGVPYAIKGSAMVKRDFPPSFPLAPALKDARLVLEAAGRREDLDLPVTRAVEAQMSRAVEDGHGEEDMAATLWASVAPATEQR